MTTTTRLIFSPLSSVPKVIGIEVAKTPLPGKSSSDQRWTIHARREVILSSGAINTPQLLLLSGIGPKIDLDKLAIPLVKHLSAVGQNLSDVSRTPRKDLITERLPASRIRRHFIPYRQTGHNARLSRQPFQHTHSISAMDADRRRSPHAYDRIRCCLRSKRRSQSSF